MTDGQSASLSSNKVPIWGLRPDLYYCQTVIGLLISGALSDERTGLLFARVTVSSIVYCQYVQLTFYMLLNVNYSEQRRVVAYCRQPASTVTLGIEPRWDPWPYISSVSRLLFFFLLSLFLL
jgi:hypothetical protein